MRAAVLHGARDVRFEECDALGGRSGWAIRIPTAGLALVALFATSCSRGSNDPSRHGLVGAWKLALLEEGGADGALHRADCSGSLVLTRDGRMSVQVMYRNARAATDAGPVQYAQGGYEASFGQYELDAQSHSFTYRVEGALVRALVGKDLKRLYKLGEEQLVVEPPTPNEHWRVTWERYGE
jgi:hypothetical protein